MRKNGLECVVYKAGNPRWRVVVFLAIGALILFASWRVRAYFGVKAPDFLLTPEATPLPAEEEAPVRISRDLTFSAHSWYALQLGAFTQENAARQLAQEFVSRGAAGFVHYDGSAYRVLAAAYPTRSEAQSVQQRLSAQNVSTYIQPCAFSSLSLRAGGEKKQLEALCEAAAYLDGLDEKFYALSAALDAHELEDARARAALLSEGATAQEMYHALEEAFRGEIPASLQPLCAILTQLSSEGAALANENSAARTGAALKRCQLIVFYGLNDFVQAL